MSECAQWEVRSNLALQLLNEAPPHEPSRRIVWEWEIDGLIEEFQEVLL